MPKARNPRHGSMQFWPRKKAKRVYARVRSWVSSKNTNLLGFCGYKVGMGHIIYDDNRAHSLTKGTDISTPVTVVECPPIKILSIRFYKNTYYGKKAFSDVVFPKPDKSLSRKISMPKSVKVKIDEIKDFDDITLVCHTQPRLTGIGKKKPEVFEIGLGGTKEEKLKFAKEKLGTDVKIEDVFSEGDVVEFHNITKGKGFQGPVKRFGVALRSHKAEKSVRNPGSLGGWVNQGGVMYRVAHAGQMGYHQRTEFNKWLMKIGTKPEEINPKSGFKHYGNVKNSYVLFKGSVAGPAKRIVRFNLTTRPNKLIPKDAPSIKQIIIK